MYNYTADERRSYNISESRRSWNLYNEFWAGRRHTASGSHRSLVTEPLESEHAVYYCQHPHFTTAWVASRTQVTSRNTSPLIARCRRNCYSVIHGRASKWCALDSSWNNSIFEHWVVECNVRVWLYFYEFLINNVVSIDQYYSSLVCV